MCFAAIHWAQIGQIVYGTEIADVQRPGFNELTVSNQRLKKWGRSPVRLFHVKSEPCRRLLGDWASLPGRRLY